MNILLRSILRNITTQKCAVLITLLILFLSSSKSYAETTECTEITTLPTIITVQGVYCFKTNLTTNMTTGNAIDIQTNNVTIDFNGFKLGGLAAGLGTYAIGVYAFKRSNIILRNGNIRGFIYGINLASDISNIDTNGGHIIERNHLDGNTFNAIRVDGANNTVRNNKIVNTGGTTYFGLPTAYGIQSIGRRAKIIANTISNTFSLNNASAAGIELSSFDSGIVKRNIISQTTHSGTGTSYGIRIITTSNNYGSLLIDNVILNSSQILTNGIYSNITLASSCVNNQIMNSTGSIECHDDGGNVERP